MRRKDTEADPQGGLRENLCRKGRNYFMRGRFSVLSATVILVCMLTACGDDLSVTLPGTTPRPDAAYWTPEETADVSPIQPIPLEDIIGEGETKQEPSAESEPSAEPEPIPTLGPQEIRITISAAGDVTLGNYYDQSYWGSFRETYDKEQDPSYFFENVYDIFSADDMTIVNLEGPLTLSEERREEKTYCFSGDPEYVNILTAGSVEAVGMGNNHRQDYLQKGTEDTVKALDEVGITYAYDRYTGKYETTQGILIGYVSVSGVGRGANVEKYLKEGIEALQEEGCDLIIASCHWGVERVYYPDDYQMTLGRKCIDWGADLVIGHHPHVFQGIEEYEGKYIVYSLGNFCFGGNRNPEDKDCLIVQQTFTFIDGEKQEETQLKVIPCSVSSVTNRNDYKPTPAEGEEAERILGRLNEYSFGLGLQFDEDGFPITESTQD